MAQQFDVPGIGTVTAQNFAQEDTLQEILRIVAKMAGERKRGQAHDEAFDKKVNDQKKKDLVAALRKSFGKTARMSFIGA